MTFCIPGVAVDGTSSAEIVFFPWYPQLIEPVSWLYVVMFRVDLNYSEQSLYVLRIYHYIIF